MYSLHRLHTHLSRYFHFLILVLNSDRNCDFLISSVAKAHILGPLNVIVSAPLETVHYLFEMDFYFLVHRYS